MHAMLIHDNSGKMSLWLKADSFIEYDSLNKFVKQSPNGLQLSVHQKDSDGRAIAIYIDSAPVIEKPDPFWKKWFKKGKSL